MGSKSAEEFFEENFEPPDWDAHEPASWDGTFGEDDGCDDTIGGDAFCGLDEIIDWEQD